MSEPTYDELKAEVTALRARLAVETPILSGIAGAPSPPHMTRSTDRTRIDETPRQTTITHTHVEPTDETFPPGAVPQAARIPSAAMPFMRKAVALPTKGRMTEGEIIGAIDGIKSVIVSGVESASYGDKRSEFRSLAELRQILNGLEEELDGLLGRGGRIRQIRMTTQWDKGL